MFLELGPRLRKRAWRSVEAEGVVGENGESKLIPEDFRAFNRAKRVSSTEEGPSPMAGHLFLNWSASSDEAPCLFWDSRKATE